MNIENIDERLLRTERERDEARAEVERLRNEVACHIHNHDAALDLLDKARAENARLRAAANERLRAAANERAITELSAFRGWAESDGDWSLEHGGVAYRKVVGRVIERIAALRAEQQAAPVPPAVEVFREAAKNCTGEMFGEAAAVKPKGQEFVFEGVMWVPAPGQKQDDIGRAFRHLTDFIGSRVTMRPVKPPADAPSRPSVEVPLSSRRWNGKLLADLNDNEWAECWTTYYCNPSVFAQPESLAAVRREAQRRIEARKDGAQ